jgi:hypothetical protein
VCTPHSSTNTSRCGSRATATITFQAALNHLPCYSPSAVTDALGRREVGGALLREEPSNRAKISWIVWCRGWERSKKSVLTFLCPNYQFRSVDDTF